MASELLPPCDPNYEVCPDPVPEQTNVNDPSSPFVPEADTDTLDIRDVESVEDLEEKVK